MIGPTVRQRHVPRPAAIRVNLRTGDVRAIEVVENGDVVRLAVYDEAVSAIPLTAALLSRDERRKLVSALEGVDVVSRR